MTLNDLINQTVSESTFTGVDNDIMKAAVDKMLQERRDASVEVVKESLAGHIHFLKEQVDLLRAIRKQESKMKVLVARLDRANKFFRSTGNPFPLLLAENADKKDCHAVRRFALQLGIEVPAEDSEAWVIPNDFQPKEE